MHFLLVFTFEEGPLVFINKYSPLLFIKKYSIHIENCKTVFSLCCWFSVINNYKELITGEQGCESTWHVKVLAAKLVDLIVILGTQEKVKGENHLHQVV